MGGQILLSQTTPALFTAVALNKYGLKQNVSKDVSKIKFFHFTRG